MKEGKTKTVKFKNTHSDLLKEPVHYLENDLLDNVSRDHEFKLAQLAIRYELPGLFKLCENSFMEKLKNKLDVCIQLGSYQLVKTHLKFLHGEK